MAKLPDQSPSNPGDSFILNEKNLDETAWGFYDEENNITYVLGFYLEKNFFLGVYCEARTASPEEAVEMMEANAQKEPKNFVFLSMIQNNYVDTFGPGLKFRLKILNKEEAVFTIFVENQIYFTHKMTRFR